MSQAVAANWAGDSSPLDKLLSLYAPLVKRIAKLMMMRLPASVEVDDLVQIGMIGLMDAIPRFDPAQGVQFETFVSPRIRGAMLDDLRRADWVPRQTRKHARAVSQTEIKLRHQLDHPPTEVEITTEMGLTLKQYRRMERPVHMVSIEDLAGADGPEFLDRYMPAPELGIGTQEQCEALAAAIKSLPERQQRTLEMRYEQGLENDQIGVVLGVSGSRVSQLHAEAVEHLRIKLKAQA